MAEPTTLEPIETLSVSATASANLSATVGTYNSGQPNLREVIRVRCTVDACLRFTQTIGSDPTATTDDMELTANTNEYFDIPSGGKVSVIRATSAVANGVLKITRCRKV